MTIEPQPNKIAGDDLGLRFGFAEKSLVILSLSAGACGVAGYNLYLEAVHRRPVSSDHQRGADESQPFQSVLIRQSKEADFRRSP